jgi:hypothetical protein
MQCLLMPLGVAANICSSSTTTSLTASGARVSSADNYCLCVGLNVSSPWSSTSTLYFTEDPTNVTVVGLAPASTYTLAWRAHRRTINASTLYNRTRNSGWDWLPWGDVAGGPFQCNTSNINNSNTVAAERDQQEGVRTRKNTNTNTSTIRMYRASEFTLDVDLLSDHNSGDVIGEAELLTLQQGEQDKVMPNMACVSLLSEACPRLRARGAPCLQCTSAYLRNHHHQGLPWMHAHTVHRTRLSVSIT